jgi:hypothetical protein
VEPRFLICEVSALPWPHLRFKCANATAFWGARDPAAVLDALSPAQLRACWTHTVDWRPIAELAVELVRAGHEHPSDLALRSLGTPKSWYLVELFSEPIFLNGDQLGNGQHRVCAMKAQGVPLIVIENQTYDPHGS